MNKQLLLLFCLSLFQIAMVRAQVAPPCPTPPPPGAEACPQACVYCNFDGYTGINNGSPSGGNIVCGQISIHNDQWFGFVAGSESITINIATSNCQDGNGLQAAFFANCQSDALVCNGGSSGGAGQPLTLTYNNFVPGQTYFLMIDGWTGDVCDFEIEVLDGSVSPPASGQPAVPDGPTVVCPGAQAVYTIPEVYGAGYYQWTAPGGSQINGGSNNVSIPAPGGTQVTVTFGNNGGTVCVRVGNACSAPLQACLTVTNKPIPVTVKPEKTICFEDLPYTWDEQPYMTLASPGTVTLTSTPYDSYLSCDSVIKQTIRVKSQIKTNLSNIYICEGSCYVINGNSYCDPGSAFQEVFDSYQGCDSIVQFNIVTIPVNAVIGPVQSINCNSQALTLNSNGSTSAPSVSFVWTNASWMPIGNQPTQNVSTVGTYNLIVTNNFAGQGCKDTATVFVPGNTTPPGASATGGNITCVASSTTLQGSSPTSGVNFQWSGPGITPANQNLQNPTVSVTGTYTLTVQNPVNGCTSTATVTVTGNNTPPTASATGGAITCTQSSVVITTTTDAPSPTYNWAGPGINTGNQGSPNPSVVLAGPYSVTITNPANGCFNTATATVTQDVAVPTASAGTDQTITCLQSSVMLNGSGAAGGAPVQFVWTGLGINPSNQGIPTPTVDVADTYILTVTNTANGCFKKDTVLVSSNVTLPTVNAGADQTLTCATTSVPLGGSGSSQGANFTATWTGPGINTGNQNLYSPTVSQPGSYTLTIQNIVSGCSATDNVAVSQNIALPTSNAGADQILTCTSPNGITLNGSGTPAGVTYLWSGAGIGANNETQQTPTVTLPDTYTLQVTNPVNGCTHTDQVIVTQDANVPTANAGGDLALNCTISSVDIDGSASSSGANIVYQWSGPGISGPNTTAQSPSNITLPGTYSLTVTNNSNNCVNTDIVVIEIDTITPTASAGPGIVLNCYNKGADTLDASASSLGNDFSLLWSGPGITSANESDETPLVSQPGVYTVTITNIVNQCTATAQTNVADDQAPPTADAGTDPTIDCVTTSTIIGGNSSSGSNFTYSWSGPGITAVIETLAQPTVAEAGNYNLVVTNITNGCSATDNVTVNTNAVYPTASAGSDGLITCAQPNATLVGSGSSTGSNIQIVWNGPGITPVNQNQVSPNVTQPGAYILTVTNTVNSCVSKDTVLVDENTAIPAASAGQDLKLDCQIITVDLDGSLSDTGATIVYLWNGNGIHVGNQNLQSPVVDQPGSYTLLVTDTENGCTAQDDVVVDQDIAQPSASAGNDFTLTCAQNTQAIDGSGSSVGAIFNYVWQGPGINTGNFDDQNPVVANSGTYILIVTNIQNNCTATDQVYVALDGDFPVTNAGPDKTLTCQSDTLQLDGSQSQTGGGITYAWDGPGIVAGQNNNISPSVYLSGAYTITVTNTNNGCSKTDIVNVGEDFFPPIADAGNDQVLTCANSTTGVPISADASSSGPGFTLLWSGPGITPANQNLSNPVVLVTGLYTLVVSNTQNGCTSTDDVFVNQDQNLPTANAGNDQTITCDVLVVTLDGTGSSTNGGGTIQYQWSGPGIAGNQSDPMPTVSLQGSYVLTVFNPLTGCQASDNVEVLLDNQPPVLTVTTDTINCTEPLGNLTVSSSLQGSTFEWSGPSITQINMGLASLQVFEPGLYSVTGTAPNGCKATVSAEMYVDDDFPEGAAEGSELNCNNNGTGTISGQVVTPGATFSWTGPGGFNSSTLSNTVTQPGIYTFTIVSPNGCPRPIPVEVTADFEQPQASAFVADKLDCNTTSLTLTAGGTSIGPIYTYTWSTSGGNIVSGANGLSPVVDQAGAYTLLVSNNINGCTNSATVIVENDPEVPTSFDLTIQDIKCFGDKNGFVAVNDIAGGTEPFVFSLDGGTGSSSNQYSSLTAGTYTLSLEDANGCKLDTTFSISEPNQLLVELGPDVVVQLGEEASVTAQIANTTPLQSVAWNYAPNCDSTLAECLEFTYLPLQSYRHEITVRDSNGCLARDQVLVVVRKDRLVYVPNIFNPSSSDPLNAILMIHGGIGVTKVRQWQIFDRWGSSVFVAQDFLPNDPTAYSWDGKVKGQGDNTGVYTWFAEIEFLDGQVELFKGDVTIIR